MLIPLVAVLGVFIFAAWLLQRINRRTYGKNTGIQIHSAISVGPNERILLIETSGKWLLIGSAPGRINTLLIFDNQPNFSHQTQTDK